MKKPIKQFVLLSCCMYAQSLTLFSPLVSNANTIYRSTGRFFVFLLCTDTRFHYKFIANMSRQSGAFSIIEYFSVNFDIQTVSLDYGSLQIITVTWDFNIIKYNCSHFKFWTFWEWKFCELYWNIETSRKRCILLLFSVLSMHRLSSSLNHKNQRKSFRPGMRTILVNQSGR